MRQAPSHLLTCVYPQVDLEVVGGAEGLAAVGAVLGGRALAALAVLLGQRRLDAPGRFAGRVLPDICGGRHTEGELSATSSQQHPPQPRYRHTCDSNTLFFSFLFFSFLSLCLPLIVPFLSFFLFFLPPPPKRDGAQS